MRYQRVGSTVIVVVLAAVTAAITPGIGSAAPSAYDKESSRLAGAVRTGLVGSGFDGLVDFTNIVGGLAQPAAHLPNVDVAVIELDADGTVVGATDVLYDRDHPSGYAVQVPQSSLLASGVQFSRWRTERWDDQSLWDAGPASADVVVDPRGAKERYMIAYPASVLKEMVAFTILRMVDDGTLSLSTPVTFHDVKGQTCGAAPSNPTGLKPAPKADGATDTVAGWYDQMITVSDNFATCVLLQSIYDRGRLEEANSYFGRIGLPTLRMLPAHPEVGSGWSTGTMVMGALDAAKLSLIAAGAKGTLWTTSSGRRVTANELSPSSRAYWRQVHAEQSFNEVLNPVNLCGSPDAYPGIPSTVPSRWIDPATGHVLTYDGDLAIDFGYDVRPCVARAEVTFTHKTGLTYNAGGDTGIVRALPGQDGRWYIVSVLSNIGNRFGDADHASSTPDACEGVPYVCYPRAFGRLGAAIDSAVKARPQSVR